jgi:hypothetical protein
VHTSDDDERTSAIYAAVIRAVVSEGATTTRDDSDVPVFVVAADEQTPIPLEVQVAVSSKLEDFATLRFVDERSEAVDETEPGRPVLQHGVLVALGEVPSSGTTVTVEAERYENEDDHRSYEINVEEVDATWVTSTP